MVRGKYTQEKSVGVTDVEHQELNQMKCITIYLKNIIAFRVSKNSFRLTNFPHKYNRFIEKLDLRKHDGNPVIRKF